MVRRFILSLLVTLIFTAPVHAQVEGVFVERYYVSDAQDATDTIGGVVLPGSITYRIFVDLAPNCKLTKIYGDANHPLEFTTSTYFFNHLADGQSFGKDIAKVRYGENTFPLDSWLTIGQVTRTTSRTWFGVPKSEDTDGSFVGGANNDGGSSSVPGGLLVNSDSSAGIAVTSADGNDTMITVPGNWFSSGIVDPVTGNDSTIFGSIVRGDRFFSNDAFLTCTGVSGKIPAENQVLVAQLTTTGDLTFKINVVVEIPAVPFPVEVKYVAQLAPGEVNSDTLQVAPSLNYPPVCGCTDPLFLEYSSSYACSSQDSCRTLVVFGCTDTSACNYDPGANFNLPSLCCYPGYCNDRNLTTVCPSLNLGRSSFDALLVYPNPVGHELLLQWSQGPFSEGSLSVLTMSGQQLMYFEIASVSDGGRIRIRTSELPPGMYLLRLDDSLQSVYRYFIKE